ncbi:hypothetical protein GGR57DRAFT_519430 [Xylariaceae sp. FL1272]|nr:hypothetical protein GGR57DRAFT_519430 [Xylariaceae sp. FL1272]
MASLLSLPRELRDQIIEDLAWLPVDPPKDSAALLAEDRMTIPQTDTVPGICEVRQVFDASQPPAFPGTKDVLARLEKKLVDYVLDIFYRRNLHVYPTCLSVPAYASNVRAVYTQFRISNVLDADAFSSSITWMFRGGAGGPPLFYWIFYHLLRGLTRLGPQGKRTAKSAKNRKSNKDSEISISHNHAATGKGITIENVIIDFVPTEGPSVLPLGPYKGSDAYKVFRGRSGNWKALADSRLVAGDLMSDWIIGKLELLMYKYCRDCLCYNKFVYERIGNIEVRLDGVLRKSFDLGSLFAELTDPGYDCHFAHEKGFQEWLKIAARKGKAAGFKVTAADIDQF